MATDMIVMEVMILIVCCNGNGCDVMVVVIVSCNGDSCDCDSSNGSFVRCNGDSCDW